MKKRMVHINRQAWEGFFLNVKRFATSRPAGRKARWLFVLLLFFLFGLNGLSVLNSYVGRDFMSALEDRNRAEFIRMALIYVGVFAGSTILTVIYRYAEETLGLVWREWATRQSILGYANNRVYYRLQADGKLGNPDQRIADDTRIFSTTTLSFLLLLLNGVLTIIAFSGVLWSISPRLFVVAVLYASAGTFLTYLFGRPLIRLNYDQLDKEADLRSTLIYLRENAESIALSRRERHLVRLNLRNLSELVTNFRRIISINRSVNFFTAGYNWLIQIIPALIVAPLFFERRIDFGVVTQSAIAFTQLSGAFSLIITQFQSISSYTAVFARLAGLSEAVEKEKAAELCEDRFCVDEDRIAYDGLTVRSPRGERVLVQDLSFVIPQGRRVVVIGGDEAVGTSLFHATAGLRGGSEGRIVRPPLDQILLIPEMPYLPPGTVKELLMGPWPESECATDEDLKAGDVPEERILNILRRLRIESSIRRVGGLNERHRWENVLPLDKQQLLVAARILLARPRFVFLNRPSSTLEPDQVELLLRLLREKEITYVTFESDERSVNFKSYDAFLEVEEGGSWSCREIEGGIVVDDRVMPMVA